MITGAALRQVNRDLNKSLERLSTGLRINRASDDAAGLSVSESLRTQVRGSHVANRNAQDGIALLQLSAQQGDEADKR
jgi:flagellin